jgi:hypothetical protein
MIEGLFSGNGGSIVMYNICAYLPTPTSSPYEVDFFNLTNLSSRTMALVSTQPLTEMSTSNHLRGKGLPVDV